MEFNQKDIWHDKSTCLSITNGSKRTRKNDGFAYASFFKIPISGGICTHRKWRADSQPCLLVWQDVPCKEELAAINICLCSPGTFKCTRSFGVLNMCPVLQNPRMLNCSNKRLKYGVAAFWQEVRPSNNNSWLEIHNLLLLCTFFLLKKAQSQVESMPNFSSSARPSTEDYCKPL